MATDDSLKKDTVLQVDNGFIDARTIFDRTILEREKLGKTFYRLGEVKENGKIS